MLNDVATARYSWQGGNYYWPLGNKHNLERRGSKQKIYNFSLIDSCH